MLTDDRSREELLAEIKALRSRLEEAEAGLQAIHRGWAGAPVVGSAPAKQPVSPLKGVKQLDETVSEERLRLALDASQMGIFDWDIAANHIAWTQHHERLWGFQPGEFGGTYESFSSRVHPDDLPGVNAELTRCIASKDRFSREFRVAWPDGSLHWIAALGEFTLDESGRPSRMRGTVVEVTDRKLAECALYANRELLDKIINSAPSSIFAMDRQHRFTLTNQAYLRVWSITAERLLGHNELETLPPETAARLWADNEKVMRTGQPMQREEELQLHDGLTAVVMTTKFPLRDKDGAVVGLGGVATDVTARKSAERQLSDSEERLRMAMDAANMGAFDWDLVRNRIVWSRRHQELWGYGPGEFGGSYEDFSRRVHSDDLPKIKAELARSKAGRCHYTCEYRLVLPGGAMCWVAEYGEYAFGEDGQPTRMYGMVMDITERKQAEKALLEATVLRTISRHTRNLIETSLDPLIMISPEGKVTDVNAATETATGYSRAKLIGTDFASYFDDPQAAQLSYLEAFKTGTARDHTLQIRHCDGRLTTVLLNASVFQDDQGKVQGVFAAARDITELNRAEQTLRESERKFSKIFHDSPIGIAISRASDGKFIDANAAFLGTYGYEREEIIGYTSAELGLWENPNHREHVINRVLQEGLVSNIEVNYRRKSDPTKRTLLASLDTFDLAGEPCMVGFVFDITDRKRAKDYLQESERKYRLSSQRLSQVIWATNVGTWEWNIPTGDVQLNERWAEIVGYSLAELEPVSIDTRIRFAHPDDLKRSTELVERCFTRESEAYYCEIRMRHKNGDWIWVQDCGRVVEWSQDGKPVQMSGTHQDITERKLAEEKIRASESRLQILLETASDGIHVLDMRGNMVQFSDSFSTMLGYAFEETAKLNMADWEAAIPKEQQQNIINRLVREPARFETKFRCKDGTLIDVEINAKGVELEGSHYLYASARDITQRKALENELIASKAEIEDLYENSPCGYHSLDKDGTYERINATELDWLGYRREDILGIKKATDFFSPVSRKIFKDNFAHFMREGHIENLEFELLGKNGITRHVIVSATAIKDGEGRFLKSRSVMYDITELKNARETLERLMHEQQAMLDNELVGIVKLKGRRTVWLNKAMEHIFGYGPGEMDGQSSRIMFADDASFQRLGEVAYPVLKSNGIYRTQLELVRKDGKKLWIDASGVLLPNVDEEFLWMMVDNSLIKQYQDKIEHIAFHDSLTGLPNRLLLTDHLHKALAYAERSNQMLAVCFLDLDGFKPVNDTFGHDAGDKLLIEIARRLQACIRANDTVGRMGGDEFVLALTGLANADEYQSALRRVVEVVNRPVLLDETHEVCVTASIGIALFPQDAVTPDALLRHADQAMYNAKQRGKNRYRFFSSELEDRLDSQRERLERIRQALKDGEFRLFFQPKVDLNSQTLFGMEALIRWQHPEKGLLLPADFLDEIECRDLALAVAVGEWVVREALRNLQIWQREGMALPVSINLFASQLHQPDFVESLRRMLSEFPDVPSGRLLLEIAATEKLPALPKVQQIIEACQQFGVAFSLEDFGTGYSSLAYLSQLSAGELKIGKRLVNDLLTNHKDQATIIGIIALGNAFHRAVVAEGVETEAQIDRLLELGCKLMQGYKIARPMPPDQIAEWVRNFNPAGLTP
jgi:diguanylate cyclase (GGDEF)-like protein/PAS domain S-box-containing protein